MVDLSDASRRSRLFDDGLDDGTVLLHADLHNHSLLSDGLGNPEQAFAQMREAGLDAAALTDHASIPHHRIEDLELSQYPDEDALALARTAPRSFDEEGWRLTARIADAHDVPGSFTALRGFEWTEPWLGHVNVWFSDSFLPVTTPGQLAGLHEWLAVKEPNALFGYNHPGREPGRLHDFAGPDAAYLVEAHTTSLRSRMVAIELFNRTSDFLFSGYRDGLSSPVLACLDAGWRPGFIGCSDEHGRSYGLAGRGRTGLWAHEHSRAGLRAALMRAQTFATRERGLRLDATLDGVRMGGIVPGGLGGTRQIAVDLATTEAPPGATTVTDGQQLQLQVLGRGAAGMPAVHDVSDVIVGAVTRRSVELPADAEWVFLRVADPDRVNDTPGPLGHPANARAVAYCSPWWPA